MSYSNQKLLMHANFQISNLKIAPVLAFLSFWLLTAKGKYQKESTNPKTPNSNSYSNQKLLMHANFQISNLKIAPVMAFLSFWLASTKGQVPEKV